ncbi:IS110 family transposase, partial [Marinilactibacillus piezotolerans]
MALDVSKGKSYVVIYEEELCVAEWEIKHNQEGFNQLKSQLCKETTEVVFEATGVYSKQIESFFKTERISYCILNPLLAKKQTDGLRGNKTDKVDAHKLAQSHYRFDREKKNHQTSIYSEIHEVSILYDEVHANLIKQRVQLHAVLQQCFPEIETLYSSNLSKYALNIIERFPHPAYIKELSKTRIKNIILASTKKNISKEEALLKADQLIHLADVSYPAVDKDHFLVTKVQYRIKQIQQLFDTKERLSKKMIEQSKKLNEFSVLVSIPGIGPLTAALIISELGDIRRFSTSNQLNAYVGIDIRTHQSGTMRKKDRINKRGNARARKILFFTIRNMLKTQKTAPNHIVDYYYKLKKQPYSKRDKVAV